MQEQRLQETEEPAGQVRVSSRELVEAISAIEARQQHSLEHDTIALGEAIDQLGLTITAEELLAEVRRREAQRRTHKPAHRTAAPRHLAALITLLAVSVCLNLYFVLRTTPPGLTTATSTATTATGFDRTLQLLRANSFDDGKLAFVRAICKDNVFTSAQARAILTEFSFDAGRVDAAEALYPRVSDRGNFLTVLDTFSFDTGRKDLLERLGLP